MLEKLMPKTDEFFKDFEDHAALTARGVRLFLELLEDFRDVARKCLAIKEVEHQADEVAHRAFARLHTQFITPFDRAEIHRLLSRIDDVLDLTDAAASRLGLYEIDVIIPPAKELATLLLVQTEKMQDAVRGLRNLKAPAHLLEACKEINRLENQADNVLRSAVAGLFKGGHDALTVIKWKEILELIESATDRCEDVADVIEGVLLEHA